MNMHPDEVQSGRPVMSERRVALLGALLVSVGPLSMGLFTPAMPELVHAFETTEAAVKLTLSLYFAGFAFMQLVCGPLADGLGRKPVTVAFMLLYLGGSVMALFAPTVEILIAARILQGCGSAVGITIARAIVRDLFTSERAARIMNMMILILGVAPAFAPTLGGVVMELFGWEAVFLLMVLLGLFIIAVIHFCMVETVARDPSRVRPAAVLRSYRELLGHGYFLCSGLVLAGGAGAVYTQSIVLPFILMDRVGLTPTQFGLGMMMQSGSFLFGSLAMRSLMKRFPHTAMVPAGLVFVVAASVMMAVLTRLYEPTFLLVMGPVAVFTFGVALTMPTMSMAAVAGYPHMAGAASSMTGFMQMGGGLAGGLVASAIGNPVLAMATVIPAMGTVALVSYLIWRTLPEPALAHVVLRQPEQ